MTSERGQKIERLFHAALRYLAEERAAFLAAACAGDQALRQELDRLLATGAPLANSSEALLSPVAADGRTPSWRRPKSAELIGHYRIAALIGAGGMGEVYQAEDIRLGRQVALKFLPHPYTVDGERERRFEQEARAASALNHPNLITIYEIGQWEGSSFIVTEFIEGQTLDARLQQPLAWREALDLGLQVASALAAAHAAGIVHRDIKPTNLMVRHDGYVKVLDFGLAKLTAADPGAAGAPAELITDPGRGLGTIRYMSPEQALGQAVDPRTDIFSLGVVLYEVVTGQRPFDGTSEAAIYDALLNKTPAPITELKPYLPAQLQAIINRTLAKERAARYQTAAALRADLQRLTGEIDSGDVFVPAPLINKPAAWRRGARPMLFGSILLALLVAGWLGWSRLGPNREAKPTSPATVTRLTNRSGPEYFPSLSPDGNSFVYASRSATNWDIYLQRVGGQNAINLTEDSQVDNIQPAFSNDGERLAFRSEREGGGIFVMGATGENPTRVAEGGYTPAWSPDDQELVCAADQTIDPNTRTIVPSSLWIVNLATGAKRTLATRGTRSSPVGRPGASGSLTGAFIAADSGTSGW